MKSVFATLFAFLTVTASAATLTCSSKTTPENYAPTIQIVAKVEASYLSGSPLTKLTQFQEASENFQTFGLLKADETYRPRTDKNKVRFAFHSEQNEDFDGIVHGLILPKVLTAKNILGRRSDGALKIEGYIISSTDSYHDGIYSYFKANCFLK